VQGFCAICVVFLALIIPEKRRNVLILLGFFMIQGTLITKNDYSIAINGLLAPYHVKEIYYGIGLPTIKHSKRSEESKYLVNFIVGVTSTFGIDILYKNKNIKMP